MKELEIDTKTNNGETSSPYLQNPSNGETAAAHESDDIDSSCSTPYVSAPSSPGRGPPLPGFFYSAPASPIHFVLSSSHNSPSTESEVSVFSSFDFEFSAKAPVNGSVSAGSMSSADELFLNGQIRPMKLSKHLQRPQRLSPLLDLDETERDCDESDDTVNDSEKTGRGRDVIVRDRSLRRRTRSMSPLRSTPFQWYKGEVDDADNSNQMDLSFEDVEVKQTETETTTPTVSVSSSRSSSAGRSSKRWVFLKELLYRSKSEGRNDGHNNKFWSSISFSPIKDRKLSTQSSDSMAESVNVDGKKVKQREPNKKPVTGKAGKKGVSRSAHERLYTANRAQAEEMRRKTFLPYRQGLLGCLGLSSKSYDAMSGFVGRALNPVSSR